MEFHPAWHELLGLGDSNHWSAWSIDETGNAWLFLPDAVTPLTVTLLATIVTGALARVSVLGAL